MSDAKRTELNGTAGVAAPVPSNAQLESLFEPAPSTVLYRSTNTSRRAKLTDLIDNKHAYARDAHGIGLTGGDAEDVPFAAIAEGDGDGSGNEDTAAVLKAEVGGATKLNWVNGVLIPCLLNIWGVIMFLRLGYVASQAGLALGTVVILFSNLVTTITALSLSAIATNGEVEGGGAYYLISRSLGPVYGGTIGILFFIAQSVATSMYVVGFAESLIDLFKKNDVASLMGDDLNDIRVIGIIVSCCLLSVALVGIGWYAKTQVILLVVLVLAMLSVFIGAFLPDIPSLEANLAKGFTGFSLVADGGATIGANFQIDLLSLQAQSFFSVFSVFFPAVTGIMAGANLSGDLEDPSVAIPKGTLIAIVVSCVSYILLLWFVGLTTKACAGPLEVCPEGGVQTTEQAEAILAYLVANPNVTRGGLLDDKLIMESISFFGPLVYVGVFAATLSSALASLVGAPRILQSVAKDELFPWPWLNYFSQGRGASNEPIRAYFLTFVINCGCVLIASLDSIAPLISNFFMISYALTNYACFASSMARAPGWRPSFKYYNKWLSLFGALLCLVVMALMDWATFLVTIIVAGFLMTYLTFLEPDVNWGAAGEARKYISAITAVENLNSVGRSHAKTFRPQYLVMAGKPGKRRWLIKFVAMLQKGNGLIIHADVVINKPVDTASKLQRGTSTPADSTTAESTPTSATGELADPAQVAVVESTEGGAPVEDVDETHNELALELTRDFETVLNRRRSAERFLDDPMEWRKRCPQAFADVVSAGDVLEGFKHLVHTSGLGPMRPNTVVIGFKRGWTTDEDQDSVRRYESLIRVAMSSNLGIMIVRDDEETLDVDLKSDITKAGKAATDFRANMRSTKRATRHGCEAAAGEEEAERVKGSTVAPKRTVSRPLSMSASGVVNKPPSTKLRVDGDRIDVWWVADDGGLTMLIPYLLQQSRAYSKCKLRVITVADYNAQESLRLQKTEMRMVHLLQKFRIDAEVLGVDANLNSMPSEATQELMASRCAGLKAMEVAESFRFQTLRMLRLSELMKQHSHDASTVFMTLPIPESGMPVRLYMSWLEMLTCEMPATVLMRGNNENVLTFFC